MKAPAVRDAARRCHAAGLAVLPACPKRKTTTLTTWKEFQERLPTAAEVNGWFGRAAGVCAVCGTSSGNLELIDFDARADRFQAWCDLVEQRSPGLLGRLYLESSQSGGMHVAYRCEVPVCGNLRLAQRCLDAPSVDEVEYQGKRYKPRRKRDGEGNGYEFTVTLIETRGQGGLFLCAPTPGYVATQGSLADLPVITSAERDILLNAAEELNEAPMTPEPEPWAAVGALSGGAIGGRPGDDFNARGNVGEVLRRHGWTLSWAGRTNQYWVRPGKDKGHGATFNGSCFYVFSSNAPPFEPDRGYSPFSIYLMLEHAGDPSAAARALARQGFGTRTNAPARVQGGTAMQPKPPEPVFVTACELRARYRALRTPVIDGLLRQGETMNLIAAPKAGKSWLSMGLALAVASGTTWLGRFATTPSEVLILDNELHPETCADRLPQIAEALNLDFDQVGRRVHIQNLRGGLCSILEMGPFFESIAPGRFGLIVLDAFYRFMPPSANENDNTAMASAFNAIDRYAGLTPGAFVLVHHSAKGAQGGKAVTDVGAGAGSQSRAADTHLVLRPHEEDGCMVLDAAARSWPPIKPIGLRARHPVWEFDPALDTSKIRRDRRSGTKSTPEVPKPEMTVEEFAARFFTEEPELTATILDRVLRAQISARAHTKLMAEAEARGVIQRWTYGPRSKQRWSTLKQPPKKGVK